MNCSDLLSNFNIDENYIDIILLILIISVLCSYNNNAYNTCPYYIPCWEWDKKRRKHKKQSENVKAESLNKDCCQNNNICTENTFGFFNSYSSNSQNNILFVVLIIALLFLIQKLYKDEDGETENIEE